MTGDLEGLVAALAEAWKGAGHTRPNPPVGAVVVRDGAVLGAGHHRRCGGDHAEVDAIRHCAAAPEGATLYVTLEPCSHPGRVGACTEAIAAAKLARVVYAIPDPNPKNRGGAKAALGAHGIVCECAADFPELAPAVAAAKKLIAPFAKHVTTGLPYVTVKIAMSLDGRICDDRGDAKWVSSESARRWTGHFREFADAIMVGAETVRRDDPSLLSHGVPNDDLIRVVVSRRGDLPKSARIFTDGAKNETLVFDDAKKALEELGRRGVMHVLCEGGLKLAVSLAEAGLVDEWVTVLAPKVIGTRPIGEAVVFDTMSGGTADNGNAEFIAHFGKGAEGALS